MTTKTIAQVQQTKQYKALIAIGLNPDAALKAAGTKLGVTFAAPVDERLQTLIAGGFTEAEAREQLGLVDATTPAVKPEPVKALTSKEQGDALVEAQGLAFTKGRVYVTPDINEAIVRVRKTGRPETVASSGVGRTKAVLIFREESGDVAVQNLTRTDA